MSVFIQKETYINNEKTVQFNNKISEISFAAMLQYVHQMVSNLVWQ